VGRERREVLEALERLVEFGPEAERARILGGDEREVAVDTAAHGERVANVVRRVVGRRRPGRARRSRPGTP
jgi:hypothetical protein